MRYVCKWKVDVRVNKNNPILQIYREHPQDHTESLKDRNTYLLLTKRKLLYQYWYFNYLKAKVLVRKRRRFWWGNGRSRRGLQRNQGQWIDRRLAENRTPSRPVFKFRTSQTPLTMNVGRRPGPRVSKFWMTNPVRKTSSRHRHTHSPSAPWIVQRVWVFRKIYPR